MANDVALLRFDPDTSAGEPKDVRSSGREMNFNAVDHYMLLELTHRAFKDLL